MPSLNFVLPHWLYWGVLVLFPLLAMWLVARQRRHGAPREPILFNAYLFWLTAGFLGGIVDKVLSFIIDFFLTIPFLLAALIIAQATANSVAKPSLSRAA